LSVADVVVPVVPVAGTGTGTGTDAAPAPASSAASGTRGRRQGTLGRLGGDIPVGAKVALAVGGAATLVLAWAVLAATQSSSTQALIPSPAATWSSLVEMARSGDLLDALVPSARRVAIAYSLSLAVGVSLGLLMGCFRAAEAFLEPTIGFLRYIPATGLTVLFVLWLGIDEGPKVGLVVAGTVFYNIIMIGDVARSLPLEQVNAAYTLGAGRFTVLRRVVLPHSYPGIVDVARVNLAAAWLMLVVGELQGGQAGLAIELTTAGRFRQYDRIWAILIVFGAIGLLSDVGLRWLRRRTAPWSEGSR
jgi:NitT/TauT family transport system permease protein